MSPVLRVGVVAGEVSGDILGAGLLRELKRLYPGLIIEGIGGERMQAEGLQPMFPMERLSVMGLIEPLKRLPELLKIRRTLKQYFIANPPDVFIGIDAPDFNLDLELALRAAGITTVHYVSPSVWAWRQRRVHKIKRAVDLMLTLFPFENAFFQQHAVPVCFIGHPLADEFPLAPNSAEARATLGVAATSRIVALLPGSRANEVKNLAPLFLQAARLALRVQPDLQFLLPAATAERRVQLTAILHEYPDVPVTLVDGRSREVMQASDAVVLASGTATLEAMLLKRPMVVAYRMAALSFCIMKWLAKIAYVALPNLLAGEKVVPELLQNDATPEAICAELLALLTVNDASSVLQARFLAIHQQLRCDASRTAAAAIAELVNSRQSVLLLKESPAKVPP